MKGCLRLKNPSYQGEHPRGGACKHPKLSFHFTILCLQFLSNLKISVSYLVFFLLVQGREGDVEGSWWSILPYSFSLGPRDREGPLDL